MNKRCTVFVFCLLASMIHAAENTPEIKASAPIKNFRLPTFNEDGIRETYLRAEEARVIGEDRVEVYGMRFTAFAKDGSGAEETVVESPLAVVFPAQNYIQGPQTISFKREDLAVTGEEWSYDHNTKTLTINKNAHIAFNAPFIDLIK